MRADLAEYVEKTGRGTCAHGHEINDANGEFYRNGTFYCKECRRQQQRERRIRRGKEKLEAAGKELTEASGEDLRSALVPYLRAVEEVRSDSLAHAFDDLAARILVSLDDEQIMRAAPKDRLWMAAVAVDKAQLLKGLPTQIVSGEQRIAMDKLLPALDAELRRRGITQGETSDAEYEIVGEDD